MPIVDVIILLLLASGAVIGFKRGFVKQTVISAGAIAIIILAFMFKNPISIFLYERLPFFNFDGIFAGVTSLNILLYEIIAFFIAAGIFTIIFRLLVGITHFIEKILEFTIFLGIPSKIMGAIMGVVEAYIWIFIVLYILSLPFININLLEESKYKNRILTETPLLSSYADKTVDAFIEIYNLKDKFKDATDSNELNKKVLDVMLKHKIVTVESIERLYASGKLKISTIESILNKYR